MASFNDLTALFSLGTKVGVNMSSCTAQTTAEAIQYITTNYTVPAQTDTNKAALKDLGTALGVTMTSCTATTDAGVIDYIADNYTAPAQLNSNVTALTDLGTSLGVDMTSCTATTDAGVIDFIADNYVAPSGGGAEKIVVTYQNTRGGQIVDEYTCDHTKAELISLVEANTNMYCVYKTLNSSGVMTNYVICGLASANASSILFSGTSVTPMGDEGHYLTSDSVYIALSMEDLVIRYSNTAGTITVTEA